MKNCLIILFIFFSLMTFADEPPKILIGPELFLNETEVSNIIYTVIFDCVDNAKIIRPKNSEYSMEYKLKIELKNP